MSVLLEVLDECGFSHVDSQLADVGHVIADAFEVLGHEKQARIARRRGRFGHHHFNQTMKNVVVEIVDFSIALNDFARRNGVVGGEGIQGRS